MKVFLSWSGETSESVAIALHDWLPSVIQAIVPWMSSEDIAKGAGWFAGITNELAAINAGIVCVTPDNVTAPWLNFEAGALSKSVANREMVCTYLFRMKPSDVTGPLSEFQASLASKDDTRKLIVTLNKAMNDKALPEGKLTQAFELWWPHLEKKLKSIPETGSMKLPARSQEEMIEEVLDIVRWQAGTIESIHEMGLTERSNRMYSPFHQDSSPTSEMLRVNTPATPFTTLERLGTLPTKPVQHVNFDYEKPHHEDDEESETDPETSIKSI
jgi:hypothetical protein